MGFTCCVPNCGIKSHQTSMHRFPGDSYDFQRFIAWLRAVNNTKLFNLPKNQILIGRRVCSNHFSADQWECMGEAKLKNTAVPNIHLSLSAIGSVQNHGPSSCNLNDHNYFDQNADYLIDDRVQSIEDAETRLEGVVLKASEALLLDPSDHEQVVPTYEQFSAVCRMCLGNITATDCMSIYDDQYNISLSSLIEEYCKIQIPVEEDQLPQHLCAKCVKFIVNMHSFRSKCHRNSQILRTLLDNHISAESNKTSDCLPQEQEQDTVTVFENNTGRNTDSRRMSNFEKLIDEVTEQKLGVFRCRECPGILTSEDDFMQHDRHHKRVKVKENLRIESAGNSAWLTRKKRRQTEEHKVVYGHVEHECNICKRLFVSMKYFANHKQSCKGVVSDIYTTTTVRPSINKK